MSTSHNVVLFNSWDTRYGGHCAGRFRFNIMCKPHWEDLLQYQPAEVYTIEQVPHPDDAGDLTATGPVQLDTFLESVRCFREVKAKFDPGSSIPTTRPNMGLRLPQLEDDDDDLGLPRLPKVSEEYMSTALSPPSATELMVARFHRGEAAKKKLAEMYEERKGSSEAIAPITLLRATTFLGGMPADIDVPLLGAEPDGYYTFEWCRGKGRDISIINISIGEDSTVYWAADVDGVEKSGSENCSTCRFSDGLLGLIRQVSSGPKEESK